MGPEYLPSWEVTSPYPHEFVKVFFWVDDFPMFQGGRLGLVPWRVQFYNNSILQPRAGNVLGGTLPRRGGDYLGESATAVVWSCDKRPEFEKKEKWQSQRPLVYC